MAETSGIRKSPYEPGLYFVDPEPGTTLQSIGQQQWQLGTRYELLKVLGYGSFSAVCLALDKETGEKVALKRIGNVLHSPEQAKRVLREICILRRLQNPNVIGIRDCFTRPSATGQCRIIGGKLVNMSVDVYIAQEFGAAGDMFHLRGQVGAEEVASIMWQLLGVVKHLHDHCVWHRDLKSQNVFLTWELGERVPKLGDFGSARSAIKGGYTWAEQPAPNKLDSITLAGDAAARHSGSFGEMAKAVRREDLYLQYHQDDWEEGAAGGTGVQRPGGGFKAPLTRVVATPCYRAPEVVMSRGAYSAAIDVWSLGCIFGELLQRVQHVGGASTPNLQVAPLFAMHGMPKTPEDGETFDGQEGSPGCETTRSELQALFAVIGTPCWKDVAAVQSPAWRRYLHRLPGKAPTLFRRFAPAGERAVDLLARLLAFDPDRRCSAEEAMSHEYFAELRALNTQAGGGNSTMGLAAADDLGGSAMDISELPGTEAGPAAERGLAGPLASAAGQQQQAAAGGAQGAGQQPPKRYWEEEDPSRALGMLEDELSSLSDGLPPEEASQRLRAMLEAECSALSACPGLQRQRVQPAHTPERSALSSLLRSHGSGLQLDTAATHAPPGVEGDDYGADRLSNVADTWHGRELDPERFLGPGRHGEWTPSSGAGPAAGPTWGVSDMPPGAEGRALDPKMAAVIHKQQAR